MRSLEQIRSKLEFLKPVLRERYNVETIEIFGSYARCEQSKNSDLDLLVTYSEPLDFIEIYHLRKFLQEELKIKVDVISKLFLNPFIKERVLNEAVSV